MKTTSIHKKLLGILFTCLIAAIPVFWLLDEACLPGYLHALPVTSSALPGYVTNVWPFSDGTTTASCYANSIADPTKKTLLLPHPRGIEVEINTTSISDLISFDTKHGEFYERVSLYVDGVKIPDTFKHTIPLGPARLPSGHLFMIADGYIFSWSYPITTGTHLAKVTILTASEKLLEYAWHFTIR